MLLLAALITAPNALLAQERPPAILEPTATPTPEPIPSPVVLPPIVPTLPDPEPTAAPTPRPRRAAPPPAPSPMPSATTEVVPVPPPPPVRVPPPPPAAPRPAETNPLLYLAATVGAAALAILIWARRRRRSVDEQVAEEVAPPAAPSVTPPASAVPAMSPTIDYRPSRIGLNLISATIEGEVTLANPTDTPLDQVRVRVAVLGAATGHAAAIAAIHRAPGQRLAAPPFALPSGERRTLRAIAAISRDAIAPLTVADRAIFVPLVVVTVGWHDGEAERRLTRAFAVGVDQADSPKLAPIPLEGQRTYDRVAARPHGGVLT